MEKPKFWKWGRLRVDRNNCHDVLRSSRVHNVQDIKIMADRHLSPGLIKSWFTKIARGSIVNLKRLHLAQLKCSSLPPELFGKALLRVETVVLYSIKGSSRGTINEDQVLSL